MKPARFNILKTTVVVMSLMVMSLLSGLVFAADSTARPPNFSPKKNSRYVFSVTLHTEKEINSLLTRAERLSHKMPVGKKNHAGIALVLHGDEIAMFNKKHYKKFRKIVDKAARLDSHNIIEIKVCKTRMNEMNISEQDLPSFVEVVPYGPDEVERLIRNGYTYL